MKHLTSTLDGALLDAAAAKAEGLDVFRVKGYSQVLFTAPPEYKINSVGRRSVSKAGVTCLRYSREWAYGGPIIERERIAIENGLYGDGKDRWIAATPNFARGEHYEGATPLIAAMRAYVDSKLGDEVDLPE